MTPQSIWDFLLCIMWGETLPWFFPKHTLKFTQNLLLNNWCFPHLWVFFPSNVSYFIGFFQEPNLGFIYYSYCFLICYCIRLLFMFSWLPQDTEFSAQFIYFYSFWFERKAFKNMTLLLSKASSKSWKVIIF